MKWGKILKNTTLFIKTNKETSGSAESQSRIPAVPLQEILLFQPLLFVYLFAVIDHGALVPPLPVIRRLINPWAAGLWFTVHQPLSQSTCVGGSSSACRSCCFSTAAAPSLTALGLTSGRCFAPTVSCSHSVPSSHLFICFPTGPAGRTGMFVCVCVLT